jgi:F-type H+-transporting ATPase subunit a
MPEHTSFFSYLIAMFPAIGENAKKLGHTLFGHPVTAHNIEPLIVSLFIVLLLATLALITRSKIASVDEAVIPEDKLTLRTVMELGVGYVYDSMKDIMGPRRAKQYFPVVGTAAFFVFFSNVLGLIPGFVPPTSSWNITLGCALVVFVAFNYYGLKENGIGYIKHLAGPVWWLAWLILPLELISVCLRPLTLSIRLMLNMSVDHLLSGIVHSLFMWIVPLFVMMLGVVIVVVQTMVFMLLSSVYIGLATEHEEHDEPGHGHKKDHAHA